MGEWEVSRGGGWAAVTGYSGEVTDFGGVIEVYLASFAGRPDLAAGVSLTAMTIVTIANGVLSTAANLMAAG